MVMKFIKLPFKLLALPIILIGSGSFGKTCNQPVSLCNGASDAVYTRMRDLFGCTADVDFGGNSGRS